jgi:hypothetical protein
MSPGAQMRTFWSRFSLFALAPFLGAVFCTFVAFGFLRDIQEMGRFSRSYLAFVSLTTGVMAVGYALAMARDPRRGLPAVLALQLVIEYVGSRLFGARVPALDEGHLASRLRFDATMSILTLFMGYLGFVAFIARQGVRRLRVDTEVILAREIHETLVPRVSRRSDAFEIVGASFPAHEVGGDLVDVIGPDTRLTCYVADVSGHGVPAGTLMAAVKSAARMRLLREASAAELLTDLNQVLFGIRRANMFATAACIRVDGARMEYSLAGHLPILHWRRATRRVVRLEEGNTALGLFEDERFECRPIETEAGDVLAVVTDGLTEVTDRRDREVGLDGIEAVLADHAEDSIDRLFDAILAQVRAHGPQRDDQTLLLIRVGAAMAGAPPDASTRGPQRTARSSSPGHIKIIPRR